MNSLPAWHGFPRRLTANEQVIKAKIHISLGQAAAEFRLTDLQHTHFLRSLFIARQVGDTTIAAQALLGLGGCFLQRAKYTYAHQVLRKAIQSFQAADNLRGVALALHTLGQVYTHTFEYRRAVNAFKYAYTLFQHQQDLLHQASSLVHLGRIFVTIDPETAEKVCREVTDLLISQTSVHSRRQSEIILARYSVVMSLYYQQVNQPDLAFSLLKEGMGRFSEPITVRLNMQKRVSSIEKCRPWNFLRNHGRTISSPLNWASHHKCMRVFM